MDTSCKVSLDVNWPMNDGDMHSIGCLLLFTDSFVSHRPHHSVQHSVTFEVQNGLSLSESVITSVHKEVSSPQSTS